MPSLDNLQENLFLICALIILIVAYLFLICLFVLVSMRSVPLNTSPRSSVASTPAGNSVDAHSELERFTLRTSNTHFQLSELWEQLLL